MNISENQAEKWNNFWKTPFLINENASWSKKRIIKLLEPFVKKDGKAIDAGCGSGFFSQFFLGCSMQVLAIDNSEQALQLCKSRCSNLVQTAGQDLVDESISETFGAKFDIIFSDGLLEHFSTKTQIKILTNFRNALSMKGKVVSFVPNKFSPWQLIRPFMLPGISETPLTLKKLIKLNEAANLRVIQSGGINVLPMELSPEKLLGSSLGMLLYTISERNE